MAIKYLHLSSAPSALSRWCCAYVFNHTLLLAFHARVGAKSLGGFLALSALPGKFLLKDVVLLAAAKWSFGEAWTSSVRMRRKEGVVRHESDPGGSRPRDFHGLKGLNVLLAGLGKVDCWESTHS